MIRQRGKSTQVIVYVGRDPLTGRKRWVSRQVAGTGRAALKEAKQIEAKLLAEVAAGRHQEAHGVKVGELVDRWLEWRQAVKPMSPGTAANYRRCIDLKIKPALGDLAVSRLDTATLDRFYAELRQRVAASSRSLGGLSATERHADGLAWSSPGLAVQASGVWADLPGDGASAANGRQPETAS